MDTELQSRIESLRALVREARRIEAASCLAEADASRALSAALDEVRNGPLGDALRAAKQAESDSLLRLKRALADLRIAEQSQFADALNAIGTLYEIKAGYGYMSRAALTGRTGRLELLTHESPALKNGLVDIDNMGRWFIRILKQDGSPSLLCDKSSFRVIGDSAGIVGGVTVKTVIPDWWITKEQAVKRGLLKDTPPPSS